MAPEAEALGDPGQAAECGEEDLDQGNGQDQSDKVDGRGLEEELGADLQAGSPYDLAQPHLARPVEGTGRGEVYIVDPGHEDDEECGQPHETDRIAAAVRLVFLHEVRGQVNVGERL